MKFPQELKAHSLPIYNKDVNKSKPANNSSISEEKMTSEVVKIVWFYENNSFEEFFPRR